MEARIPLFMTMEAVFSFKNLNLQFADHFANGRNAAGAAYPSVFKIDQEVAKVQELKIRDYAKQQHDYLAQHSCDTIEDKQAKALRELYKMCKTEEEKDSDQELSQNGSGGSGNSARLKKMFNDMAEDPYDIRMDDEDDDVMHIDQNEYQTTQQLQYEEDGVRPPADAPAFVARASSESRNSA